MFTGIIKEVGRLAKIVPNQTGKRLLIHSQILRPEIEVDDSVCVEGVCQTAVALEVEGFWVQAVHTTLEKTTFKNLREGDPLNLELSLTLQTKLGGHMVSGHVGGLALIEDIQRRGDNFELWIRIPRDLSPYTIKEGSLAVDGISLTIADKQDDRLMLSIIPHTWQNTSLSHKTIGSQLNIEVDMLAKYVESLLQIPTNNKNIDKHWLASKGFIHD